MNIQTTRFGIVSFNRDEKLVFPAGLIGFEEFTQWIMLRDRLNANVAWLQSLTDPELAVALVSPKAFVADYQVRTPSEQLAGLELTADDKPCVLSLISKNDLGLTINLKAPVIVNFERGLGRQIVTSDEQPLQLALPSVSVKFRKSA